MAKGDGLSIRWLRLRWFESGLLTILSPVRALNGDSHERRERRRMPDERKRGGRQQREQNDGAAYEASREESRTPAGVAQW